MEGHLLIACRGVSHDLFCTCGGPYLVDQVEHGGGTLGITSSEEAEDIRRVSNALDGKLVGSTQTAGKSIEEGRALAVSRADVALLCSSTRVDDSDAAASGAIGELVVGIASVLTLGYSCCGVHLLGNLAGFESLSVLLDGKASVDDICDWEAGSLLLSNWCWGGESGAKHGGKWEDGLELHFE